MCTILFAWQQGPKQPFLAIANRDEFHGRPTQAAHWHDEVFSGLDLRAGGTWMGIHRRGRFAAVTNFREPVLASGQKSRGELPLAFLKSQQTPAEFCQALTHTQMAYGPFNLLVSDGHSLWYMSNRGGEPTELAPGIYGLSNGLLDDPWPKVEWGKATLKRHLHSEDAALFQLLTNNTQPDDDKLPNTGVGMEMERLVAPLFIQSSEYGTRSSTIVRLLENGEWRMAEQQWDPQGNPAGPVRKSH